LPGFSHKETAGRMLIATARQLDCPLLTRRFSLGIYGSTLRLNMARTYTLHRNSPAAGASGIDYAAALNAEQYAAVSSPPGRALVIAGAGSGKTRTLTYRVAWLLDHGTDARQILLLTFTNKATREMIGSTDGRFYRGQKANGYGVHDFRVPRKDSASKLTGYGTPPGLGAE